MLVLGRIANIGWLFVDILFLFVFGILAVLITRATDSVAVVMTLRIYLIAAGLIWSLLALFRSSHQERSIAAKWFGVDVAQILWTWAHHRHAARPPARLFPARPAGAVQVRPHGDVPRTR